jgi:hypothetical protein
MKKEDYKFRRAVEKDILSFDGVIFGGHVRDVALHDIHAIEYYSMDYEGVVDIKTETYYNDPDFFPEWKGRLVVSSDIDCYMREEHVASLLQHLRAQNISVRQVFERADAKSYLPNLTVPHGVLKHMRFKLSPLTQSKARELRNVIMSKLHPVARQRVKDKITNFVVELIDEADEVQPLTLDVMVASNDNFHKYHPPFGNMDFECNCLMMTSAGIQLSPALYPSASVIVRHQKLNSILQDIRDMKARYVDVDNLAVYRVVKMKRKGWEIPMNIIQKEADVHNDVCIICHDELAPCDHFKLPCCNARYHRQCLLNAFSQGDSAMEQTLRCVVCKQYTDAFSEAVILKHAT